MKKWHLPKRVAFFIGGIMRLQLRYLIIVLAFTCVRLSAQVHRTAWRDNVRYRTLDINNLIMQSNNYGDFYITENRFVQTHWRKADGINDVSNFIFDQGLWVIGKISDSLHIIYSQWRSNTSPGPIIEDGAAMLKAPEDSLTYRVYKITTDDGLENQDYQEWPIGFGAPVDQMGSKPYLPGLGTRPIIKTYSPM